MGNAKDKEDGAEGLSWRKKWLEHKKERIFNAL
jgi:hypothetical protein